MAAAIELDRATLDAVERLGRFALNVGGVERELLARGRTDAADDASPRPRKSSRPPKANPEADDESSSHRSRPKPNLFSEPETGEDSGDFF